MQWGLGQNTLFQELPMAYAVIEVQNNPEKRGAVHLDPRGGFRVDALAPHRVESAAALPH
eukprot:7584969-Pyramimonas_sp.AAC.1